MNDLLLSATRDAEWWLRRCAHIRQKDGSIIGPKTGKPFVPNRLQQRVLEYYRECQVQKRACLIMILKPRQKGASTIAEAVIYHHMRTHPGLNGSLMGDIAATSDKVFEMFRRYYEGDTYPWGQGEIDKDLNIGDEITLPNGSKWYKETAGSTNAGRGGTIQVAHMDEVAFFQTTVSKDPTTAYLGSFYKDGPMSLGFATSTANGATGWFYDTWGNKQNGWKKIFAAWFEFDDSTMPFSCAEEREIFERSLDEDERKERELYKVTLEQLKWRRYTINTDYRGDAAKFRQEMPSNDEECFMLSSRPRFDMVAVKNMLAACGSNDHRETGNIIIQGEKSGIWLPDPKGSIHRQEEPIIGCKYLISVDTCTGEDQQISGGRTQEPDWHDVQVWRAGYIPSGSYTYLNPKVVAWHKSQIDTDVLAEMIAGLSFYYGTCLVVPEVNGMGGLHIVKLLVKYGVPVFRRKPHTNSKPKPENEELEAFGWLTDPLTRKWIIDALVPMVRLQKFDCHFKEIVEQFRTFVVTESGKSEAMPGKHDDSVIAAAIGLYNLGAATEYRLARVRGVDLARLARDPGYLAPSGFRRKAVG